MKAQKIKYTPEFLWLKLTASINALLLFVLLYFLYFSSRLLSFYFYAVLLVIVVFIYLGWKHLQNINYTASIVLRENTMSFPYGISNTVKLKYDAIQKLKIDDDAASITLITATNKYTFFEKKFNSELEYFDFKLFLESIIQ